MALCACGSHVSGVARWVRPDGHLRTRLTKPLTTPSYAHDGLLVVSYDAFIAIAVPAMPPAAAALEAPHTVQQHNVTAGAEAAAGPATQVMFADAADSVVTSSTGHQIVEGGLSIDIVAAEAAAQQASEQPSQYAVKGIIDPQSQLFSGRLSITQHHHTAVLGPVAFVVCFGWHSCSCAPVTLDTPNSKPLRASLSSSFSTFLMPSPGACPEHFSVFAKHLQINDAARAIDPRPTACGILAINLTQQ